MREQYIVQVVKLDLLLLNRFSLLNLHVSQFILDFCVLFMLVLEDLGMALALQVVQVSQQLLF